MITTRLYILVFGLLVLGALAGCSTTSAPEVVPEINRLRVKTIRQQLTSNVSLSTVSAFSYDAQNRLSSILAFQLPDSTVAPVERTLYQYDTQNRLTQVQHAAIRRGANSETYTYTYNAAGQVAQLTNSPSTLSVASQYNAASQLTGYSKAINVGGLQSSGVSSFTFTGQNLTASYEAFSVIRLGGPPSAPPAYSRSVSTTYTFDTKPNPFYGSVIIPAPGVFLPSAGTGSFGPFYTLYGGIDNSYNLSQNNVLSAITTTGSTLQYNYTYNTANLPTSRTSTLNGVQTEVLRYEYESY